MHQAYSVVPRPFASPRRQAIAWVASGFALLALASHFALPLASTVIPATLQPQAVLLVAALWPRAYAMQSVSAWLLAGFLGAPVFAMGLAGSWLHLMPSAGYLLAYLPVTALLTRVRPQGAAASLALWLAASGLVLLLGTAWLALFVGVGHAIKAGFLPFVVGDLVKTLAALLVLRPWKIHRSRAL